MNPKTFLFVYLTNPSSQAFYGVRLDSRGLSLQQASRYLTFIDVMLSFLDRVDWQEKKLNCKRNVSFSDRDSCIKFLQDIFRINRKGEGEKEREREGEGKKEGEEIWQKNPHKYIQFLHTLPAKR